MPQTKIVLSVLCGMVDDVYCSDPDTQVVVVDWDADACAPGAPDLVEISTANGRTERACVGTLKPHSLAQLAGTEVEQALKAAEVQHGTPQT